jgi:hypothetical protein
MTTALEVAKKALELWNRVHPGESLDQQCQRYSGYYWLWAYQGNENIRIYPSAHAAYKASQIQGTDVNKAPIGSTIYWDIPPAPGKVQQDHNGTVVSYDGSRAVVAYATRHGDTIAELGNGVKLSHADSYPHTAYGWSWTNGANVATTGLTDYNAPPVVTPPVVTPPVVTPPVVTPPPRPAAPTKAELDAAVEALKLAGSQATGAFPSSTLAGLFSGHPVARRRTYYIYAGVALLISAGPDVAVAGWITGHDLIVFSGIVTFATSILLKLGSAFGLMAASNTKE